MDEVKDYDMYWLLSVNHAIQEVKEYEIQQSEDVVG